MIADALDSGTPGGVVGVGAGGLGVAVGTNVGMGVFGGFGVSVG